MRSDESSPFSELPPSLPDRIDQICDRFEDEWRAGRRPRIVEFVGDAPEPGRDPILRELIAMELRLRLGMGEWPTPADYQRELPGWTELIDSVFSSLTGDCGPTNKLIEKGTGP